jgi:hypothetical protein
MNPDVVFALNHDWDAAPMARTIPGSLILSEDSLGIFNESRMDPGRADVNIVRSAVEGGELNSQSLAFWCTQQDWDEDYTRRTIREIDMDGGDTSVVTFEANPYTRGTVGMRRREVAALASTGVPALLVERARIEKRQGGLSPATAAALQAVLDLVAAADVAVDYAQPILAEILGVANPDEDQDAAMGDDDAGQGADSDQGAQIGGMTLSRLRLREDAAASRRR